MSVLTRLTHEAASRLLPESRYLQRMPPAPVGQSSRVFLTFDDGPHPQRTARVLDQLAEADSLATFFLIGRRARRHPQLVRRIVDEGHSVGCHTWRHWSARHCSAADYVNDVLRSRDEVQQLIGTEVNLFRPPYGELTPRSLIPLIQEGLRIIQWSRDTRDFELPTSSHLPQQFQADPLVDGDIVLMHDDRCITSYALDACLSAWRGVAEFREIPMQRLSADSVELRIYDPGVEEPESTPQLALVGGPDDDRSAW